MAPQGQGLLWSEVLCCPLCSELFGRSRHPLNLACGHALCRQCVQTMRTMQCPLDQVAVTIPPARLPTNRALLAVLDAADDKDNNEDVLRLSLDDADMQFYISSECYLNHMAAYLQRAESERGGSVWSQELSRPVQRKLVALLCFQLLEVEGRIRAVKTARSLGERALIELLLSHQNSAHLSSNLWSAVRARGCQFLGPAMQEEVLRLILLTLSEGALIARKTLVMYIVQTLSEDYPQVSKTCVGHVVQLLYRASCFNVIKRDGESSLMQLKQEYRDYDSLRREHDAQIVQIAVEAGLRISPDQWSSLLYGDQSHRSHMQSIIDKLQSPQAFGQSIQELITAVQRNGDPDDLLKMVPQFELLAAIDPAQNGAGPSWTTLDEILKATKELVDGHVRFTQRRNQLRSGAGGGYGAQARIGNRYPSAPPPPPPPPPTGQSPPEHQQLTANAAYKCGGANDRYKTRLCRDVAAGRFCPRGQRCTYAHSLEEMRQAQHFARHQPPPRLALRSPMPQNVAMTGPPPPMGMTMAPPPLPPSVMAMEAQQPSMAVPVAPGLAVVVPPGTTAQQQQVVAQAQHQVQQQQQAAAIAAHMQQQVVAGGVSVILQSQPPPPTGTPVAIPVQMQTVWPPAPPGTIPVAVEAGGRVAWVQQWHQPNGLPPSAMATPMEMVAPMKQMYATTNGGEPLYALVDDGYGTVSMAPVAALEPTSVAFVQQLHHPTMPPPAHHQSEPSEARGVWELTEEEQLKMRRDEIINRLAAMQRDRPDHRGDRPWLEDRQQQPDEEDGSSHVSFTVATSVLHDAERDAAANLELPPLPLRFNSIISSSVESFTQWHAGDWWRPCTSTVDAPVTSSVRTVCPQQMSWDWSPPLPTTVQAPCAIMQVCDTINQPVATPTIQSNQYAPVASYEMVDPSQIAGRLPPVIRPLPETPRDPQNVVSHSLDLIVDVKERMNDVDKKGIVSAVEKQQLEVELNIVSRQIQSLDRETKQSCLLKELEAVDKKIEDLNIG